jgi:hypothetical protein
MLKIDQRISNYQNTYSNPSCHKYMNNLLIVIFVIWSCFSLSTNAEADLSVKADSVQIKIMVGRDAAGNVKADGTHLEIRADQALWLASHVVQPNVIVTDKSIFEFDRFQMAQCIWIQKSILKTWLVLEISDLSNMKAVKINVLEILKNKISEICIVSPNNPDQGFAILFLGSGGRRFIWSEKKEGDGSHFVVTKKN